MPEPKTHYFSHPPEFWPISLSAWIGFLAAIIIASKIGAMAILIAVVVAITSFIQIALAQKLRIMLEAATNSSTIENHCNEIIMLLSKKSSSDQLYRRSLIVQLSVRH